MDGSGSISSTARSAPARSAPCRTPSTPSPFPKRPRGATRTPRTSGRASAPRSSARMPRAARRRVERSAAVAAEAGDPLARARRAAIGDHLERSEGVLLDVINSNGDRVDLSTAQAWAADLIESNRLYRHTAAHAGDSLVASVLDDLERSLLEIVHGPSVATAAQLEAMRSRLDAAALLFKVRMLADELHEQELAPVQPRKRT